jgi:hypothetical protein
VRVDPFGTFWNSLGKTVHSLTSSNGIAAVPLSTCNPWETR